MYYTSIFYICTVHCTYTYSIHYQRLKSLQLNPDRLFVIKMICQNFLMIVNKAGLYCTVILNVPYVQIIVLFRKQAKPQLESSQFLHTIFYCTSDSQSPAGGGPSQAAPASGSRQPSRDTQLSCTQAVKELIISERVEVLCFAKQLFRFVAEFATIMCIARCG